MSAVARMIPDSPVEAESNAERRLFERLRDETPDEIVAFRDGASHRPEHQQSRGTGARELPRVLLI